MTGTRKYPTADQAFGTVPTGSGHGGLPNVVFGLTGSGERDPGLFAGSCRARFAEPVSPGDPVGFSDGGDGVVVLAQLAPSGFSDGGDGLVAVLAQPAPDPSVVGK